MMEGWGTSVFVSCKFAKGGIKSAEAAYCHLIMKASRLQTKLILGADCLKEFFISLGGALGQQACQKPCQCVKETEYSSYYFMHVPYFI